ncbi:MAG: carbohydrate binding family 9 domain-containing protein, partial [Opitutales bacterium]|nr:carbohydrate binding family 9 domain-containing protein [Opitutales bacterium]
MPQAFRYILFIFWLTDCSLAGGESPIPERQEIPAYRLDRDYRPEITAVRLDEPPKIDGHLDEDVWKTAPMAGPLLQYQPSSYARMDQETFFRVAYDENYLYIAIWCWDTEPDRIVARYMRRDDELWNDDSVNINLDTFNDQRNSYTFLVNPNGTRHDAISTNNANYNYRWDGVWKAKTQITDYGWQVEVALPLTTLSFDPASSQWGLNLGRRIKRSDQRGIWSSPRNAIRGYYMSEAGKLNGLSGLKQGLGLELNPYILGKQSEDKSRGTDDFEFEWGGDFRYRITPKMSASLSYNTDFAAAETDARQVNLTRFSLFFPEKRRFFLEDTGVFNFGGLGGRFRRRTGTRASPVILPYFSRRIGLSNEGQVAPLIGAAKLSGRVGNYNIGIIDAVVEANGDLDSQNAFVGRVTREI